MPATPVHAALLHRSQVFERTRSKRDIFREFAETTVRAKPRSTITRARAPPRAYNTFHPLATWSRRLAGDFIHGDTLFSLYPVARTRSRKRAHSFRLSLCLYELYIIALFDNKTRIQ